MAPHGRTFYSATAFFALLAGTVFMWGVLRSEGTPAFSRLFGVFLVIICCMGALQSLERLLRPEKACRRTAALSDFAHHRLRATTRAMTTIYYAGWVVALALRLMDREHLRDLATDIWMVGAVALITAACLADLNGEHLFHSYRP
jgi:hypothetical protein